MSSQSPLERAVAEFHLGRPSEAAAICQQVLAVDADQPDAHHLLGVLIHQAGRSAEAAAHFQRAVAAQPRNAEFRNSLGAAYLANNRVEDAERQFRSAIQLNPRYAEALFNLGLCLERRRVWSEAEVSFRTAVEVNPTYAAALIRLGNSCERRGDVESAVTSYRRAIESAPQSTEADLALGNVLRRRGELTSAQRVLRDALSRHPQWAEGWNALGVVLSELRRHPQAGECYQRALELAPQHPGASANLGFSLMEQGRPGEARQWLEHATEHNPQSVDVLHALMRCLQRIDRHTDAAAIGRRAVAVAPQSVQAWRHLGLSLEHCAEFEEAWQAYEVALRLEPNDAEVLLALARLSERREQVAEAIDFCRRTLAIRNDFPQASLLLGQLLGRISQRTTELRLPLPQARNAREEAIVHLKHAVQQDPAAEAYTALGQAYYDMRDHDQARQCFEEALRQKPDLVEALNSLGNVLLELGEMAAGEACFEKALLIDDKSARAHFSLSRCRKSRDPDADLERLRDMLRDDGLTDDQRLLLHFAAAQIADDAQQFDTAFDFYQRGNSLKPKPAFIEVVNRAGGQERFARQLIETYSAGFFRERQGWGIPTQRPIFVVGMPRSGTTLTEQILSSHPSVHGAGELGDLPHFARCLSQTAEPHLGYPQGIRFAPRERVDVAARDHDEKLAKLGGHAAHVVDKMPGNFMHLGLIALMFPHAKIIHCRRNALDVCVSCFRSNLTWPFSDLQESGRFYRRCEQLMSHWREVLPIPIHEQVYESLVEDFEPQARALIAYCGLDWNKSCLEFHSTERPVATPSKWQVRRPIYRTSVGLWKRYERHLDPLRRALAEAVETRAS